MWCPSSLAKLVNISPITMVFVGDISIVNGIINDYKPFITFRGHHLVSFGGCLKKRLRFTP